MAASPSSSDSGDLRVRLAALVPGSDAVACGASSVVVVVEPLYLGVATALALDAGWGSVELAPLEEDGVPIPLVSFEQRPTIPGGACRVRGDVDSLRAAAQVGSSDGITLLGAPAFARPLAARLAMLEVEEIVLVPCAARGVLSADAWWASGALIRVLLDELEGRGAVLDDAAGIAVTLADGSTDAYVPLGSGARWNQHLARGGHEDDLRVAASVDSVGTVPRLERGDDDRLSALAW